MSAPAETLWRAFQFEARPYPRPSAHRPAPPPRASALHPSPPAPPSSKPAQQPITLKIRESDGNEILFKVKRSTPMSKVFAAFCTKKSAAANSYKFLVDGERLNDGDTAESE